MAPRRRQKSCQGCVDWILPLGSRLMKGAEMQGKNEERGKRGRDVPLVGVYVRVCVLLIEEG